MPGPQSASQCGVGRVALLPDILLSRMSRRKVRRNFGRHRMGTVPTPTLSTLPRPSPPLCQRLLSFKIITSKDDRHGRFRPNFPKTRNHGGQGPHPGFARDCRHGGWPDRRRTQHRRHPRGLPYLQRDDILQAVRYAAGRAEEREISLAGE
jgi:hypothetical protein